MRNYGILTLTLAVLCTCMLHVYGQRGGVPLPTSDPDDPNPWFICPSGSCPDCLYCNENSHCKVLAGNCFIDNVCYPFSASAGRDNAQSCNPEINPQQWNENYEGMDEEGVLVEMNAQTKYRIESNIEVACDIWQHEAMSYCRRNREECSKIICGKVGSDGSNMRDRPWPIALNKCWLQSFHGRSTGEYKWHFYAKLDVSQSEFEELCTGYTEGRHSTVYWLLPPCIAEVSAKAAMPKWEQKFSVNIDTVSGFCSGEISGSRMPTLYQGLTALMVILFLIVIFLFIFLIYRRWQRTQNSQDTARLNPRDKPANFRGRTLSSPTPGTPSTPGDAGVDNPAFRRQPSNLSVTGSTTGPQGERVSKISDWFSSHPSTPPSSVGHSNMGSVASGINTSQV